VDETAIGVFGGSGLYRFLDDVEHLDVDTPYGRPSAPVAIGTIGDRRVAFLPRHGLDHELPPHRINYRANMWAFHALGVQRVLAPCASGSLRVEIAPGDVVVCDQLVDRTSGRASTFFDGPLVQHVSFADPYCDELRHTVADRGRNLGMPLHEHGTVVVIEGPRFSTRAESRWFRSAGWDVVNMTQYPEAVLARELGLCYCAVAVVTDYDSGLDDLPGVEPVRQEEVFARFEANLPALRRLLEATILAVPSERACACGDASAAPEPQHA
jgi:5'-methylthioadenosine phosphorylase